jgi:hypothetical protein
MSSKSLPIAKRLQRRLKREMNMATTPLTEVTKEPEMRASEESKEARTAGERCAALDLPTTLQEEQRADTTADSMQVCCLPGPLLRPTSPIPTCLTDRFLPCAHSHTLVGWRCAVAVASGHYSRVAGGRAHHRGAAYDGPCQEGKARRGCDRQHRCRRDASGRGGQGGRRRSGARYRRLPRVQPGRAGANGANGFHTHKTHAFSL